MMMDMKQIPPDNEEVKEYLEVKLKGGKPNKRLEQYLANDRKVLSFTVLWDDTSYDGWEKKYTLNYFLSDNTLEVKEIAVANSGIDKFPMMLKRMPVPKDPVLTHYPGMSLKKEEHLLPQDLEIGKAIKIYGRDVVPIDCDGFTRAWYAHNLGRLLEPLPPKAGGKALVHHQVPPHDGIGSEEDTLGQMTALQPKAPRLNVQKIFKSDMHILRF